MSDGWRTLHTRRVMGLGIAARAFTRVWLLPWCVYSDVNGRRTAESGRVGVVDGWRVLTEYDRDESRGVLGVHCFSGSLYNVPPDGPRVGAACGYWRSCPGLPKNGGPVAYAALYYATRGPIPYREVDRSVI